VKRFLLLFAVLATSALADILPDEAAACQGKAAGAACSAGGQAGTCVETTVSRPDYSTGIPPKSRQVKMLTCVATAKGSAKSVLPWLGAGLGFLALVVALVLRPRRPTPATA
jgi:hypothetical protein